MQTFSVVIEGTAALLQHRFSESAESTSDTRTVKISRLLPRDAAEQVAYRAPDGNLYFPGSAIGRVIREAGASHKQKGSRKALKFIVPAAILILDDAIPLFNTDRTTRISNFEVDSRPVVIPSTKGRVMRHRPRIEAWTAKFSIRVHDDILDPSTIRMLLNEGGLRLGIGDYRPEKGGPFGTFDVVSWQSIEQKTKKAA